MVLSVTALGDVSELGAPLPHDARQIAKHRFLVSRDFKKTMRFYKTALPVAHYPRKHIINQVGIKGIHIVNKSRRGAWEGLNIYEVHDEVRIYVIPIS